MSNPNNYTVGWICAISTEYVAAQAFLDEKHEGPEYVSPKDNNDYTLGKIGKHNVVIAVLPGGEYGIASAAIVATDMLHSFPNIRIGLMVGIGGGAPSRKHNIRLGDIVVSEPRDGEGGVFQYDFGKTIQDQSFRTTGFLNQPPKVLRTAVSGLKAHYEIDGHELEEAINNTLEKKPRLVKKYKRPATSTDRLFKSEVTHDSSCTTDCIHDPSNLKLRSERKKEEDNPGIHYGLIASANQLMKDALVRDRLAAEMDVLCFEMEAAGLMNHFPCLVIRGICDYSDSHKNKEWQGYAAMAAAAYAKDLLCRIAPNKVEAEKRIGDILRVITHVQQGVDELLSRQHNQEHQAILNWLAPIDYAPQQNDYLNRRHRRTGQWLLDSTEYQTWLKTSKQTLFCPGIPGAGKTILTSIVVDELYARFRDDTTTGIAYLYCNFRQQEEQKAEGLLANLLKQLAQGRSSLPSTVKDLYNRHEARRTRPSVDEISRTLQSVAAMYTRVFIAIDALDECQETDSSRTQFLRELFSLKVNSGSNLFATSRFIPEIEKEFEGGLSLEIRASSEDISNYLDKHMSQLLKFDTEDTELRTEIKTEIIGAAEGMFLLAKLHTDSLETKTNLADLREAAKVLPTGLNATYKKTMEKIKGQNQDYRELAEGILTWLSYAFRQLTMEELQHALATRSGTSDLNIDRITAKELLVTVCAGLVVIDQESNLIRLVHSTAHDYIRETQFPRAQKTIATTCLTYLSFNVFGEDHPYSYEKLNGWLDEYHLLEYAARYWGDHARGDTEESVKELALKFLGHNRKLMSSIQVARFTKYRYPKDRYPKNLDGLHIAVSLGLRRITELLVEKGADIKRKDAVGRTMLHEAATMGNQMAVQLLLSRKDTELNSKNKDGQTPLWEVAERGREAIVKILLERHDVEVNAKDTNGRTPLWEAVKRGHDSVVELLLRHKDIEVNWKDEYDSRTPLWVASKEGRNSVVELLLKHKDIEVNSKSKFDHQTPLWVAAREGHETVVKLLLAHRDIEVNSKDGLDIRTPLWAAAGNGHGAVVKLLLAHRDIEVNSKDRSGQTPLSVAMERRHEDVVKLLRAHKGGDIEVNLKDKNGQTRCQWRPGVDPRMW